jgi:uncharacterized protein YbbC (DUF1343 family)
MHPIPVLRYDGEYSQMINGEHWLKNGISCKLTIIPCSYYKNAIQPAYKNHQNQTTNRLIYTLACAFEGTNVSVGRGTENNFKFMAHPIEAAHENLTKKT